MWPRRKPHVAGRSSGFDASFGHHPVDGVRGSVPYAPIDEVRAIAVRRVVAGCDAEVEDVGARAVAGDVELEAL
jgi:hypothetical protein